MSDTTEDASGPITDPIVERAHRRFLRCRQFEATARERWLDDYKFANGDEYNGYQWPDGMIAARKGRPSLTVNEVQQRNLHIKNEAKQNKAAVKYRPTGGGASVGAALAMEGLYRHIENISNAQMAQGVAIDFQVDAGLGFTIIRSKFITDDPQDGDDPMAQDIYIEGIADPMGVYLDCDAKELDGSDARYGFVFTDVARDEMEARYLWLKGRMSPQNAVDGNDAPWMADKYIRQAEYYEIEEKADTLLVSPSGQSALKSTLPGDLVTRWEEQIAAEDGKLRRRKVVTKHVKCYIIVGDRVVEETGLPGKSVPIVPWVGIVTLINKELDRKGHTRTMLSPQRMINYNWSASIEQGALQTKTPWMGPMKAFEGFTNYYETANTENRSWLPYNHRDDSGEEIPAPTRINPPTGAPAFLEGVTMAAQFMQAASGQYEAMLGQPSDEKSGKAINERQRMGDRATYHFIDHQALAIRRQGQIIMEWVPEIYDTERVLRIIGEDGTEGHVQIKPDAEAAFQPVEDREDISGILNPSIGRYEVVSDVGPDFATQRQEAFNAIVQILTQAPQLISVIGDLLFKVADFPLAEQIAERLKPGLSPEAFAEMQKQLDKAQKAGANSEKLLREAMQALAEERLKAKNYDAENAVKGIEADTKRLAVVKDMLIADPMFPALLREIITQNMQDDLGPIQTHLVEEVTRPVVDGPAMQEGPAPDSMAAMLPMNVPNPGEAAAQVGGV